MKYIIIPLYRTAIILITFMFIVPLMFLFQVVFLSIWNLKLKDNWKKFVNNFTPEYFWVEDSEYLSDTLGGKSKVYLTMKDFILNRWEIKEIN